MKTPKNNKTKIHSISTTAIDQVQLHRQSTPFVIPETPRREPSRLNIHIEDNNYPSEDSGNIDDNSPVFSEEKSFDQKNLANEVDTASVGTFSQAGTFVMDDEERKEKKRKLRRERKKSRKQQGEGQSQESIETHYRLDTPKFRHLEALLKKPDARCIQNAIDPSQLPKCFKKPTFSARRKQLSEVRIMPRKLSREAIKLQEGNMWLAEYMKSVKSTPSRANRLRERQQRLAKKK